eukprot:843546_1
MSIKASLTCIDSIIQQERWSNCLSQIANDICKVQNQLTDLIIIALPSSLHTIKESIEQILSIEFPDDCISIISMFLISNTKLIEQKLSHIHNNKWKPNEHNELISTEAIIMIDNNT